MKTNQIYHGDSAEVLKTFEPDCIDLTVTSPPYDNLRTYNGFTFDFETIAKELYRVTKPGGVVVWVVGDETKDFGESLTSFRQALYFQSCGFSIETMIYQKDRVTATGNMSLYLQAFEYMFVMFKGKPKTINLLRDRKNQAGKSNGFGSRLPDGSKKLEKYDIPEYGKRMNVWKINPSNEGLHPAPFPESLARDHILSWSNEGDIVLDCFCGSGTTPKQAKELSRQYVGIEISLEYVELINKRLAATSVPLFSMERGLTPHAADAGDSPAQQAFFTPETLSTPQGESAPALRR